MTMQLRFRGFAIWVVIAGLAGAVGYFVFGVNFWVVAVLAVISLAVNGLIIEWEDRQPGGWSE
jgi:hypothetical protein